MHRISAWGTKIALLALAYVLAGWLGLALAIPPGYATGIFPPAGIALVCVLAFGDRAAAGVWLGSFILNAFVVGQASTPETLLVAAALGAGAACQALFGALLVRRSPGYPSSLSHVGDALRFVLRGGALACLVGATFGVSSLWLAGRIPLAAYGINWFTWWLGDTLGVFVAGPLTWALVGAPEGVWRARRASLVPALLVTLAVVVGVFFLAAARERQSIVRDFEERTHQGADELGAAIGRNLDALLATERLVAAVSVDQLDHDLFQRFAAPLRERIPTLKALSWNPWVPFSDREAFMRRMAQRGGPAEIVERGPDGALVPVGLRSDYMPVAFIEPGEENRTAIGFDVLSSADRATAVSAARVSGRVASTGRILLVQVLQANSKDEQFGSLVMYPHYRGGVTPGSPAARKRDFLGVAVAVFRWAEIEDAVSAVLGRTGGYRACLVDTEAAVDERRLFGPPGCETGPGTEVGGFHHVEKLEQLGRSLEFRVSATSQFMREHRGLQSWSILIGGVSFTGLLGVLLLVMTGSRAEMEALVAQRSRELSASTAGHAEAREQLELSLEGSQLAMWDWRIAEDRLQLSAGWRAFAGSDAPLEYASLSELPAIDFRREDRLALRARLIPVLKGHEPYLRTTVAMQSTEGRRVWVHCHGKVVARDADGQALRMVGTCANVTEQVEREALLREREAQLRLLTENVPALMVRFDKARRIQFANRQFDRFFGCVPPASLVGALLESVLGPAAVAKLAAHFDEVFGGRPTAAEIAVPAAGESSAERVLDFNLVPDRDGERIVGCIALISDVTERKQLESTLREREAQIRLAVEAGGVFPWEWSASTGTLRWARSPAALVGTDHVEDMRPFIHPDDLERYDAAGEATVLRGEPYALDLRIIDMRGQLRWLAARGEAVMGRDGRAVKAFGVLIDISLRKQIEDALQTARQSAEAASRAKSDFLANLSHEIRTPLNAVLGMTELVLDSDIEAEQRSMLESSLYAGRALLQMINELLDFAKSDAGHLKLQVEDFSLRGLMRNALRPFALRAADKGLATRLTIDAAVPDWLVGDPGRLRQILFNLLGNAVKFTAHGSIEVSVCAEARSDDALTLLCKVRDTGIGVPAEMRDRIFEAFTQVDGSTTREYGGTGLGLSIVRQLVSAMEGRIWFEEPDRGGSCFCFRVRLRRGHGVASAVTHRRGASVVIAAGDPALRGVLAGWLEVWGLKAREAGSAEGLAVALADGEAALLVASSSIIAAAPKQISACFGVARQAPAVVPLERDNDLGALPASLLCEPLGEAFDEATLMARLVECLEPEPGSDMPMAIPEQRPATIMVVEDNAANRQLASSMLARLGHTVVTAEDGQEALDKLAELKCELVFMDMQMPVLDGLEATRRLRTREAAAGQAPLTVVALTATSLEADRQSCIEAGMNDFLVKPFRMAEMAGIVARWLHTDVSRQPAPSEAPERGGQLAVTAAPGLDMSWVGPLREALEDDFDGIARQVLNDLPGGLLQLRAAYENDGSEALRMAAHAFKGLVQSIGAARLGELAVAVEQAGRQQRRDGVGKLLGEIEGEAEVVARELEVLLG